MAKKRIYGEVKGIGDIRKINQKIMKDVSRSRDRVGMTELHKRSMYLRTLCDSPAWRTAFYGKLSRMKEVAEAEFAKTAKAINRRCKKLGLRADYDERWGPGR